MSNKFSFLYSIRTKFTAMILVFVAALMLTVLGLINSSVSDIVLEQGIEKGLALARGIAAASDDPLLTNDDLALFTTVKGVTESKGVLYGMIVIDGRIRAHSDISMANSRYKAPPENEVVREGGDFKVAYFSDPALGLVYDITVPITSARLREGFGSVHIGLSRKFIDEAVLLVNRSIKYLTYAGLFLGGLGAILITSIVVRPISVLEKGARELGKGNLDFRLKVNRRDELGVLMSSFNEMAEGLKQKEFIQESFGRYVAPELLDMLLKDRETWLKGKRVKVTVLFADIRGFTSFSEKTDPETLINILNDYFTLMTNVIHKNRGYVDKFIGDAVMVVFGSPVHYDGHALQAARTACEMHERLKGFNSGRAPDRCIEIGIGINTGEVVAGNLGSFQKMEYAVIGDNVNTASRLCSAAKKGEVIISKSTYEEIKTNEFKYVPLEPVTVKGKSEAVEIFSLIPRRSHERLDDEAFRRLKGERAPRPTADQGKLV